MTGIGDAKRFLLEDMFIYAGFFIFVSSFDLLVNLGIALNLYKSLHNPQGFPYSFGLGQTAAMIFSAIQFFRKLSDFRYYK